MRRVSNVSVVVFLAMLMLNSAVLSFPVTSNAGHAEQNPANAPASSKQFAAQGVSFTLTGPVFESSPAYCSFDACYNFAVHPHTNISIEASSEPVPSQYLDNASLHSASYLQLSISNSNVSGFKVGNGQALSFSGSYEFVPNPNTGAGDFIIIAFAALAGNSTNCANIGPAKTFPPKGCSVVWYSTKAIDILFDVNKTPPPIILIPGVGGTLLSSSSSGAEVWPCPGGLASCGKGRLGYTPDPALWVPMAVDKDGTTGSSGIATGDVLRSFPTNFYGGMVDFLVNKLGYKENYNLYVFPYDWRLDLRSSYPQLTSLINKALDTTHNSSLILLAHSMGGVLARSYLIYNPSMASKVQALITMGSPIWGTNRAFDAVVYGYTFGDPAVSQQTMKVLAQNFPSVYELLPWYVPFVGAAGGGGNTFTDIQSLNYTGIGCTTPSFVPSSSPLSLDVATILLKCNIANGGTWKPNPALIATSLSFWQDLGTPSNPTPLPGNVKYYAIIGEGIDTFGAYAAHPATSSRPPDATVSGHNVYYTPVAGDGDGTVGLAYAQISGVTATYYIQNVDGLFSGASAAHVDLPQNPSVQAIVAGVVNGGPLVAGTYPNEGSVGATEIFSLDPGPQMTVVDASTHGTLGHNRLGGINATLGSGSFITLNGMEYAAFRNITEPHKVVVNSTGTGRFTLDVNITLGEQPVAHFSYANVTVANGSSAQVTVDAKQILTKQSAPAMQMYQGGTVTQVQPSQVKLASAQALTSLTTTVATSASSAGSSIQTTGGTPSLPSILPSALSQPIYQLAGVAVLFLIVVVAVASRRRGRGKSRAYQPQPQQAAYQPQAQQATYNCQSCGAPLQWVPQYQRYYCPREGRYV